MGLWESGQSGERNSTEMKKKMKDQSKEKRRVSIWILPIAAYLCFVAELTFIIMGGNDYAIVFAGLCFCLAIVFFVLWREEQAHKLLSLQGRLDEALHRAALQDAKKENEQIKRLRKENEELSDEREQTQGQLKRLSRENKTLARRLLEAEGREKEASLREAAESILPIEEAPTDLDLVMLTVRVIAEMEEECRRAGIRLRLSCPNEALFCRADGRYIRLMIKNIIDNAVRYMRRNGTLVITLSSLGDHVFFAFKDDGRGLPQEETDHIFELNFQGSNRRDGNGLGLAQVKAVVSHCGGSVYARSADGMGIYIQLPRSRKQEDGRRGMQEEKTGEISGERNATDKDTAGGE